MDFRYPLKRAFFLATAAQRLCQEPALKSLELRWLPFRGHVLSPVLVLVASKKKQHASELSLCIHVSLPKDAFKGHWLAPGRNGVRKQVLLATENFPVERAIGGEEEIADGPTPIYNSLLQMDMLRVEHLKMIHAECKRIPALRDAIKLGKAWIRQRGYHHFRFHLAGFQLSMLCIYLSQVGRVDALMTDLQIFKEVMVLCEELASGRPAFFPKLPRFFADFSSEFSSDVYASNFAVSLVEPVLGMNIFFDWTAEVAAEVQRDARTALALLAREDYSALFLRSDLCSAKYDSYALISECHWMPDLKANFSHYSSQFLPEVARAKMLAKKLKFALNVRIDGLAIHTLAPEGIPLTETTWLRPATEFAAGLIFNRDECLKIVERGPLADQSAEVQYFRHFWKSRAELRRFPDGSIREAVAWDHYKDARHRVIPDIVRFVMEHHFNGAAVNLIDESLDFAWSPNSEFLPCQEAARKLIKHLQGLAELPLTINRCEVISPVGRMTSVNPPARIEEGGLQLKSLDFSSFYPAIEMLIYFEGSSRWPSEYYGMLYARQAFAVQICRQLNDHFGLSTSITESFFDVFIEGYVFRCYIHHQDEAHLMQAQGMNASDVALRNESLPKHVRTINVLATGDFAFAPTCRLVKNWISSHMYSLQLPEELVELVVAHEFLSADRPKSVVAGFIRVLRLLGEFPWHESPLLVDFEGGESKTWSVREAERQFAEASERPMIWIAPSYEATSRCCVWSHRCTLLPEDFQNLRRLAAAAVTALEARSVDDFGIFFRPSLERFDLHGVVALRASDKCIDVVKRGSLGVWFLRALPGFSPVERLIREIQDSSPKVCVYYNAWNHTGPLAFRVLAKDQDVSELQSQILSVAGNAISFE